MDGGKNLPVPTLTPGTADRLSYMDAPRGRKAGRGFPEQHWGCFYLVLGLRGNLSLPYCPVHECGRLKSCRETGLPVGTQEGKEKGGFSPPLPERRSPGDSI